MSGTLTAVALLLGAGMASGAGMLASNMAQPSTEPETPPPEPEISTYAKDSVEMPAPAPAEPAPVEPASESSTPPSEPAEMAGGAIGRPPWGVISKTVIQPALPGSVTSTVTNALGLPTSQKELEAQLISVNEQLRIVNLEKVQLSDSITPGTPAKGDQSKRSGGKVYEKLMSAFAMMNEQVKESNKNSTLITYWTQKLNPKGDGMSKAERTKLQEEKNKETDPVKKAALQDKIDKAGKQKDKEIDPQEAEKWSSELANAMSEKSMADFKKEEANRDVVKYKARVDDIRKQVEDKDKLIKELITKRDAILIQIQNLVLQTKKTPLSRDWPERMRRYADAVQRFKTAEVNFSAFVTEVWIPARERGQEKDYQDTYNARKKIYDDARSEMVVARSKLTENTMDSTMSGSSKFDAFVSEITEITQNAVDSNNNIRTEFAYNMTAALGRGYSPQVKKLADFASKDRLKAVADIYYDISKQDPEGVKKNIKQYTEFFDKIKGSLKRASDRVLRKGKLGFEITQEVLRDFVQRQLSLAYNDVIFLPQTAPPATQNSVDVYKKIRKATTEFVDEQVFTINKMIKVIADAKRKNTNDGKIKLLYDQVKSLFTVPPANFPAEGMCQQTFKASTFEYLRSGMYNNKKIEKILEGETPIKQQFLDEIGYTYVSNFTDAKRLLRKKGIDMTAPADELLRKSALDGYIKYIERQAFDQPDVNIPGITETGLNDNETASFDIIARLFGPGITNRDVYAFPDLNAINPFGAVFAGALAVSYRKFASDLRRLSNTPFGGDPNNIPRFTPEKYLEGVTRDATGRVNPTFRSISEFKDACEIDGNVGRGPEESAQIIRLLDLISKIEIEDETPKSELLTLIEKLEKDGKVDISRADQSRVDNTLATKGFNYLPNWTIMKVSDDPEDNDFIMTFLMLRSGKFKSIPYDERTTYNGKTSNARKVYARLAKAEILKLPEFKQKTGEFREDDWGKISNAFNINILIFKRSDDDRSVVETKYANKVGVPSFYVYKNADNKFSPVRLQTFGGPRVGVAAMSPGVSGPAVDRAERNIYSAFGGNIQGPPLGFVPRPDDTTVLQGLQHYASAPFVAAAPLGRAAAAASTGIATGVSSAYSAAGNVLQTVLVPAATAAARGLRGAAVGTGFVAVAVSRSVLAGMGLVAVAGASRLHGAAVQIWDTLEAWRTPPPAPAPAEVEAAVDAVEAPPPGEENNPFGPAPTAAPPPPPGEANNPFPAPGGLPEFANNVVNPFGGPQDVPVVAPPEIRNGYTGFGSGKRHKTWRRSMPTRYTKRKI